MRKLSIFALVFCMVLGLSAVAMAKDSGKEAKGKVTSVSATDKSLSVKGRTADETFWTNDATKIEENGKAITLADVKVGEWADVWYTSKDGKDWATKVVVKAPMHHKDDKKPGR
jgi:hypothetical protein